MCHELAIEEYGGMEGIRNEGSIDAIAEGARTAYGYSNDLFEVAATYILYTNQRHPFLDGNKRVSVAATIRFLSWNGIPTGHSTNDLEQLILAVADCTTTHSRESIARQLKKMFS